MNVITNQETVYRCIPELKELLKKHPDWEILLVQSFVDAKEKAEQSKLENMDDTKLYHWPVTMDEYYDYLKWFIEWVPNQMDPNAHNQQVFIILCNFYWLLDQPTGLELQKSEEFNKWMVDVANDWGSFLNTPASITEESLQSFKEDPAFNVDQYMMPAKAYTPVGKEPKPNAPSGWMSFNQFFAREVNPGLRPVAGMFNDDIIVSPADCTFKYKAPINDEDEVTIKISHTYKISELLEGSEYKDKFRDGLYMHSFLGPSDYHRFHAPVRGTVLESYAIQEKVYLQVDITDQAFTKIKQFDAPDDADNGYEFSQTRGVLILDSPFGLVAVIPVGMAQVSSVNMTAVEGAYLNKGDEFGYFLFGGSDIILLFEGGNEVIINAAPGIHYNSGMCIGEVL